MFLFYFRITKKGVIYKIFVRNGILGPIGITSNNVLGWPNVSYTTSIHYLGSIIHIRSCCLYHEQQSQYSNQETEKYFQVQI